MYLSGSSPILLRKPHLGSADIQWTSKKLKNAVRQIWIRGQGGVYLEFRNRGLGGSWSKVMLGLWYFGSLKWSWSKNMPLKKKNDLYKFHFG